MGFESAAGGRPAFVSREKEASGRPCSLWFFQLEGGRLREKDGFRVRYFLMLSKLPPPLCLSCGPVFIGKMLHGSQN
jgi:hypothetical protein